MTSRAHLSNTIESEKGHTNCTTCRKTRFCKTNISEGYMQVFEFCNEEHSINPFAFTYTKDESIKLAELKDFYRTKTTP